MAQASNIVAKARNAFNNGVPRKVSFRVKSLKKFLVFLEENGKGIVNSMFQDLQKHEEEIRMEIIKVTNHVKFLLDHVEQWAVPEKPLKRLIDLPDGLYVHHDPYGVVLVMGSWNVPLLSLVPAFGAIAAGNSVVIKPSHNAPNFGKFLATVLPKYLNQICYPVFCGDSQDTAILLEERFDYIYYTGSAAFGKIVHQAANKFLTPTTLQMGGKNPVYIDSSADLKIATRRIIWGKCYSSGQTCMAPDYILCTKSVEKKFIEQAKIVLEKFSYDNPKSCPIANKHHFLRLCNLLNDLKIAIGGRVDSSAFTIEPTIAIDVDPNHPIMQEEIFGPILPIVTIENDKEACKFINQKEKPLDLYIFTNDRSVKKYIINNTFSGGVTINDTLMRLMVENLPFGGVGHSGMGYYKGMESFRTFTHRKSVLDKNTFHLLEEINEIRYPPYTKKKTKAQAFGLQFRRGISWSWVNYIGMLLVGFLLSCVFYTFR